MNKFTYFHEKVEELKDSGVYRTLPVNYGPCTNVIELNHKRVINLSSNNYLGLANHRRLKEAAKQAIDKYGVGAGSVRTIVGNQDILEELERALAEFKKEEAVVCFQSGLNCNLGVIPAITEKGDLIVSDELNHASIIDGVRLSRADKAIYRHADVAHLAEILNEKAGLYNRIFIITDGVFSMDGDIAPLPEIVDLAEKNNAFVYVDDAHGSGVLTRKAAPTCACSAGTPALKKTTRSSVARLCA
ncbi:MAG: aminotransferase class I/II-fold pyridoxal phosphate-dependent enzyme, partial [Bacilli bacterium]|nr:aminotransferase class I/II-fold pyridoxal phosphate-dependent enzyme [Bacilli bacterium]